MEKVGVGVVGVEIGTRMHGVMGGVKKREGESSSISFACSCIF